MNKRKAIGHTGQIYSWRSRVGRHLISFIYILYTLIAFSVMGVTIMNSLKEKGDLAENLFSLPKKIVFNSYRVLFEKNSIGLAFFNSTVLTVCGTALCVFLAAMVAYGISRYKFKGSGILTGYFMVGMMVPMQVSVLPLFLMMQKMGLLNTRIGMILLYGANFSLSMYVFAKFFRTIPVSLEEAARLDGASDFRIFLQIILPICRPVIFTMALITAVGYWNDFYMPMVLLSKKSKQTLTLMIYTYLNEFVRKMDVSFAAVVLTLLPVIILYCIFSKQMVQGITGGAVKE